MNRAVWSEEIDHSNDMEQEPRKMGFAKKVGLTNMWSIKEALPVPRRMIAPSGTRDMRSCDSSHVSRVCAHGDVVMSRDDQKGEWVLKSPQRRSDSWGMGSVRR